jgi:hypothetical protein
MQRTYLALAGLALAGAGLPLLQPPLAGAAGLFQSADVEAEKFAVLARPVGDNDWTLLVLEQLAAQPSCWETRKDGLVDPALNRFDFTGICNRYIDSNGYSLRVADEDLGTTYRLQVQQVGSRLELQATAPNSSAILVVGRAEVPLRDRDGFVSLRLEPGWELKRRTYGGRGLTHLYFASPTSLEQLIARAGGGEPYRPPAIGRNDPSRPLTSGRSEALDLTATGRPDSRGEDGMGEGLSGRAIALQVIPFTDVSTEGR